MFFWASMKGVAKTMMSESDPMTTGGNNVISFFGLDMYSNIHFLIGFVVWSFPNVVNDHLQVVYGSESIVQGIARPYG